jgi:hypothetical protein
MEESPEPPEPPPPPKEPLRCRPATTCPQPTTPCTTVSPRGFPFGKAAVGHPVRDPTGGASDASPRGAASPRYARSPPGGAPNTPARDIPPPTVLLDVTTATARPTPPRRIVDQRPRAPAASAAVEAFPPRRASRSPESVKSRVSVPRAATARRFPRPDTLVRHPTRTGPVLPGRTRDGVLPLNAPSTSIAAGDGSDWGGAARLGHGRARLCDTPKGLGRGNIAGSGVNPGLRRANGKKGSPPRERRPRGAEDPLLGRSREERARRFR